MCYLIYIKQISFTRQILGCACPGALPPNNKKIKTTTKILQNRFGQFVISSFNEWWPSKTIASTYIKALVLYASFTIRILWNHLKYSHAYIL